VPHFLGEVGAALVEVTEDGRALAFVVAKSPVDG